MGCLLALGSRRGIAVAAASFLVFVVLSPGAVASAPPPRVLVCPERLNYGTGEVVNLTLYTLRGGSLADANVVAVTWGVNGSRWPVVMTWMGMGTYRGAFLVNVTNPSWHEESIQVEAQAVFPDGTDGYGSLYVDLSPEHRLGVELTPSSYWLRPGDELSVRIRVLDGGQPRDAASLTVSVAVIGLGFEVSYAEMPWTRTGTGLYHAWYSIPADLHESWLQVSASADTANATGSSFVPISVLQPHPFAVWTHVSEAEPSFLRFEFFISRDAAAVPGAIVDLDYTGMGSYLGNPDSGELTAATDEHGRASFNLSHSSDFASALLVGNVTDGSIRQGFATFVSPRSPVSPGPPSPFEVQRSTPWQLVTPDETATLRYMALHLGQPLARTWIEYAVSSAFSLLAFGMTQTDGDGNFSLTTPVPPAAVNVAFFVNLTGEWQSWTDFVYPEYPLAVTAEPLRPGAMSEVSGTLPAASEPWALFTTLLPLDASGASPDWTWQLASIGPCLPDGLILGTAFDVKQSFPSFLPKGREYLRSIMLEPLVSDQVGYGYVPWRPKWDFLEDVSIPNARPSARMRVSTTDPAAGEPIRVNASASFDEDGWVDAYQIDWGDGDWTNWVSDATFEHAYRVGRDFLVTLHVRDDSGAYNTTSVVIRVAPAILGVRLALLLPVAGVLGALAAIGTGWIMHSRRLRQAGMSPGRTGPPLREPRTRPPSPPPPSQQ